MISHVPTFLVHLDIFRFTLPCTCVPPSLYISSDDITSLYFQVLLSELSKELYGLSGGSDLVSGFRIELPAAWRNTECTLELQTSEGRVESEDILVSGPHPIFGARTIAEQFAGCGEQGSKTLIPFSVLTDNIEMEQTELNQTLLELARWRYGIFSEAGMDGDEMYPANITHGLSMVRNEGCSEEERRVGGGLCPLSSYNPAASTKQNLLCSEQSARRTVLNRFLGSDPVKFRQAELEYIVPSDTERILLLVEQSQQMVNHWSAVLAATFQFINSVSEGSELAILTFGEQSTVHLQPTRVVGGNREGLHYRIPRRISPGSGSVGPCLRCGLEAAGELVTNTTTLVILSSAVAHKNNTELMEFEARANAIIRRIVFGKFSRQTSDTRSPVYMINEDQNGLNITSDVSQALASMTENYPTKKFHMERLSTRDTEGSFSVEPSLSSDLWIQLLLDDTTDINVFEIKSPSGQIFSFPKFDAGLVYFSLRGPRETGVWSYRVRFYSSAPSSRRMLLECWAAGGANQISLRSWSRVGVEEEGSTQPVYIYAKLEQAGLPVLDAEVYAVVRGPGSAGLTRLRLRDTGSGYPDITAGDGIYSAYFSEFSDQPGLYSVTVEAVNNSTAAVLNTRREEGGSHGGSTFPTIPTVPLDPFRRFSVAPSFHLGSVSENYVSSGLLQRRDSLPPSRITDFKLANYFNNSLFLTLAWTAPGDDFTAGRAFRYEIRCFTAREALSQDNFGEQGILVHSSLVPSPEDPGTEQRCTVTVPWPEEVFYYAIVGFDAAGNRGQVSNIISVYVTEPVTTTTEESTTKFLNMKDVSKTLPLKSFIHSESLMYIIAGIISFILIVIVIILTVIIRRLGVCGRKVAGSTEPSSGADTPSLPDLCHEQSYMRTSVSYMSGYDLPEMLDFALRSPQKASAQEVSNNNHRVCDQYISSGKPFKAPSPVQLKVPSPESQHSPSVSPVNSTFTVGQSTDCSVSVSGSDHEMIGDTLQVLTPLQPAEQYKYSDQLRFSRTDPNLAEQYKFSVRPEPKPRKIPPAVPNKTVHASLV